MYPLTDFDIGVAPDNLTRLSGINFYEQEALGALVLLSLLLPWEQWPVISRS